MGGLKSGEGRVKNQNQGGRKNNFNLRFCWRVGGREWDNTKDHYWISVDGAGCVFVGGGGRDMKGCGQMAP